MSDYDINLNEIEVVDDIVTQDNNQSIRLALEKIQEILNDIDERLRKIGA